MATTEDRLTEIQRLESMWIQPDAPPARSRAGKVGAVPATWVRSIAKAWVAAMVAIFLFEPAPSDPHAAIPAWALAAGVALLASLGLMFLGAARRRAWTFRASAIAGSLGMALAYECRASGHHLGAWWLVELGVFAALTAGSLVALRALRDRARAA